MPDAVRGAKLTNVAASDDANQWSRLLDDDGLVRQMGCLNVCGLRGVWGAKQRNERISKQNAGVWVLEPACIVPAKPDSRRRCRDLTARQIVPARAGKHGLLVAGDAQQFSPVARRLLSWKRSS
ncbi:hypothetical protein [Bradyrhizobium macuxiense]|uniref:hypothetical protein n=1 Tax=Bradyrhizobium macuxiense TaxID=1755647 RepID=UPI0010A9733E|nr:hypothetical protein [Bradyrhizobium macuxiense]